MVKAVTTVGHAPGMEVVAGYVATADTLERPREPNVGYVQGYALACPTTVGSCLEALNRAAPTGALVAQNGQAVAERTRRRSARSGDPRPGLATQMSIRRRRPTGAAGHFSSGDLGRPIHGLAAIPPCIPLSVFRRHPRVTPGTQRLRPGISPWHPAPQKG